MKIEILLDRAAALGVSIKPRGGNLHLSPAERCPADFVAEVRRHKPSLLAFLEHNEAAEELGRARWLPVARQILAGEFDGADESTVRSLIIALRAIQDGVCQRALVRLKSTT